MHRLLSALLLLPYAGWALPSQDICRDVQIPVSVSTPRHIIDIKLDDDWNAVDFTFNLTRRNFASPAAPLPITGKTANPVANNYTIGASLCGIGNTVLVLTHGIIESKKYWRPDLQDAAKYSFVDAAVAAGYSVLSYDRIGVGSSSKVDGLKEAQFQAQTQVLDVLTHYAKQTLKANKVALVGHSYGSYISAATANHTAVDAVVLTGFSGIFDYFKPFVAGAGLHVARTKDPQRWGRLDTSYLTSADLYADTYIYFEAPYFEHRVAQWMHDEVGEPFSAGELLTLLADYDNFHNVAAPVLILQGQFDVSACGGDCVGLLSIATLREKIFRKAKDIQVVDDLPAGHNLNLHEIAPQAFQLIFDFLGAQGI